MKKTLCAVLLVLLGAAVPAFGANVSIADLNAAAGATIEVPVVVDNAAGIAGFQFTITYDAKILEATGAKAGDLTGGWMVKANTADKGQITVAGVDTSLVGLGGVSGSLVKLQFKAVAKKDGASNLGFTVCKLSDNAGVKISSACDGGSVTITGTGKPKPGRH